MTAGGIIATKISDNGEWKIFRTIMTETFLFCDNAEFNVGVGLDLMVCDGMVLFCFNSTENTNSVFVKGKNINSVRVI